MRTGLIMLLLVVFGIPGNMAFGSEQKTAPKPPLISKEDMEVIRVMDILEYIDLIDNMDLLNEMDVLTEDDTYESSE